MSHSTPTHRSNFPGAVGAVVLLAVAYGLLIAFMWLIATAPYVAGVVAVLVGAAFIALYIRLGRTR